MMPTPRVLANVVDQLDAIDMADSDTKGDLYEYMLGKIASAGQNGQFRTPRHIIKLMVGMTAPTPNDMICDQVWFYDMRADGFSLDDKRNPQPNKNDLPDILARWRQRDAETEHKRTEQSFLVPKAEIAGNDYDLSINRYKEVEYEAVEYDTPAVILERLAQLEEEISQGRREVEALLR